MMGPNASMRASRLLVAAMYIVYVASFAWSIAVPDTARDAYIAHGIRVGTFLPLEGPVLGVPSAVHFGPLWYYLVSVPLWVSDTWIAFVLFQGIVCGLKFPLAWHCGRRLAGDRFGLAWAGVLALPGWATLEGLVPFNASAVAAASLGVLAAWLHARDRAASVSSMLLLGLAVGIALHAHPSTAPLFLLGVEALYRARRSGRRNVLAAFAYLGGVAILFVPYFASQAIAGWPDFATARGYVAAQLAPGRILLTPELLAAQLYQGPRFAAFDLARWPEAAAVALGAAISLLALVASVFACRGAPALRRIFAAFALATLALLPWVLLLRANTPFYFMNVVAPAAGGAFAAGIAALSLRWPRACPEKALACIALALQLAILVGLARNVREGGHGTSAQALDVKDSRTTQVFPDIWFPAVDRAALGDMLCRHAPIALHAGAAFVEDRSVGTDAIFSCGAAGRVTLGGSAATPHLVGLTLAEWKALGVEPPCRTGSLGLVATPGPIAPTAPRAIADGARYFPRDVSRAPDTDGMATLETEGPGFLVVSNFLYGYERLSAVTVSSAGADVAPAFAHEVSRAYVAPANAGRVEWRIRYRSSTRGALDAVFVPAASLARGHGC
ncbi:MAG TPA: hypothetical protein VH040_01605 [Usitatibacter sp.]|nr:hypothetical protein [Usitatibacter sp.]